MASAVTRCTVALLAHLVLRRCGAVADPRLVIRVVRIPYVRPARPVTSLAAVLESGFEGLATMR